MIVKRLTDIRVIPLITLLFYCWNSDICAENGSPFEQRCIWVVRDALISPKTIDDVLDFAVENRFNHLLVQVRGRGDAFYESDLVPRSAILRIDSFDPLEYLIKQAHYRGLKVHAWVNVYLLWSSNIKPVSKDHLFNLRPDWIDSDGESVIKPIKNISTDEGYYLAPHHPEVTPYLVAVFREIATKYDIDGLHLDYVRYEDSDYGNNRDALKEYERITSATPPMLRATSGDFSKYSSQYSAKLSNWSDHRRKAITDLLKKTKDMLLDIRSDIILSAAVKPNLYEARNRFYQEWDVWLAADYLDWAMPMNYTPSLREFAANIDIVYDNLPRKYRDRIIMGLATYNQSSLDVADKIRYSRITRFAGISIFSYNFLQKNPRYFSTLENSIFP